MELRIKLITDEGKERMEAREKENLPIRDEDELYALSSMQVRALDISGLYISLSGDMRVRVWAEWWSCEFDPKTYEIIKSII